MLRHKRWILPNKTYSGLVDILHSQTHIQIKELELRIFVIASPAQQSQIIICGQNVLK